MQQGFILKKHFEILPCLPGLAKKWSKNFFCLRRKCLFPFFPPKKFFYFWLVRSPNKRCHISYSPPPSKEIVKEILNDLTWGTNHGQFFNFHVLAPPGPEKWVKTDRQTVFHTICVTFSGQIHLEMRFYRKLKKVGLYHPFDRPYTTVM